MSRKLSTRKRPDRDDYMLKEQLKIEEGIFDGRTIMMIGKLFTRNIISRLNYIIARGKEADVYMAEPGARMENVPIIVKIFRLETSSFARRVDYINGDPRFKGIKNNLRAIVYTWCKKEYGNLKLAEEAGIHAPRPYSFIGNVLAMEFIGDGTLPSPILKSVRVEEPRVVFREIIKDMRKLYQSELVHGDISEYNILIKGGVPYMIDFGQAVALGHPKAAEMLRRDITNLLTYFNKKYGIEDDEDGLFEYITGRKADSATWEHHSLSP